MDAGISNKATTQTHGKMMLTMTHVLILAGVVLTVLQTEKQLLTASSPNGATATGRATSAPSGCTQLERSVMRQVSYHTIV
jgi:hypothetical protein